MPGEIWAYTLDSTKTGIRGAQPVQVGNYGFLLSDSPFHDGLVMDMDSRTLLTGGIEDFLQQSHTSLPDNMSAAALRSVLEGFFQGAPSASAEGHVGTMSVAGEHMVVALDVVQAFAAEALHEAALDGMIAELHGFTSGPLDPVHVAIA